MLLHQTCYILKNLQSCYNALSFLRVHCNLNLIKEINFYYFSHLSHCIILSFSLTGVTSSLFSSFLFSHWSHFLSLFFIHRHLQLKTTVVMVVVPPQLFYWPIYSLNYSQLPNQYFNQSHVKTLKEYAHITHVTFKYKHKKSPNVQNPTERGEENQVQQRERIHAVQSHCRASLCRLAALVPAAPWWFRRTVQSAYVSALPSSNHLSSSICHRPKP